MTAPNTNNGPKELELENVSKVEKMLRDALRIELREEFFALQALVDQFRSELMTACEYIRDMARFIESLTPEESELLIPEIYWNEVASLYKRLAAELASAAESAKFVKEFAENARALGECK
jgi:hypothetical protein